MTVMEAFPMFFRTTSDCGRGAFNNAKRQVDGRNGQGTLIRSE